MMVQIDHDRKDSHSHDEKSHHRNHDKYQMAHNVQRIAEVVVIVSLDLWFQLHGDTFNELEESQHLVQDDENPPWQPKALIPLDTGVN